MAVLVNRADKSELERVFKKYASVEKNGERYMTHEDFVCRYLQLADVGSCSHDTISLLADVADTTKNKLISFVEFRSFESLLCTPDAINRLAFRLFDLDSKGTISYKNLKKVVSETTIYKNAPFDFDCSFIRQYFGHDKDLRLEYLEFSQLLQSLPTEHARQAFASRDTSKSGSIPALEFVDLMKKIRGFRMSDYVQDHLLSVAGGSSGREVNYAHFKGFNQFLGNLDILERVVKSVTEGEMSQTATEVQLLAESQRYNQVTPLQVSFLFELCSMEKKTGAISLEDFKRLVPTRHQIRPPQPTTPSQSEETTVSTRSKMLEPAYRFLLGSLAGATGATAVYPIDLVKTRLQNQRGTIAGEIMYKNSLDTFWKVLRFEGFFGLYRGLIPQLVGVSPEKAIKLTTNDTVRDFFRNQKDGSIKLWQEITAGGCAGASQVIFTNPLEIVKIRLQVAGEMRGGTDVKARKVVRELGLRGLYKGASACFLRDIPFSGIYFSSYAHMKKLTATKDGTNKPWSLFVSGFIAGVPAAGLVTPADVIKTRLQVKAREGQQEYKNIIDCFWKVMAKEGPRAFWKGAPARILRSSPQFGFTLLTYEMLQRAFYVDFGKGIKQPRTGPSTTPTDSTPFHLPDHIGGFRLTHSTFSSVESRFGIVFPKTN